jgi:hypothetical protein
MQWSWKPGLGVLLAVQTASTGFAASFSELKLIASDQTKFDHFGWSVAIDGERVVIGMYGDGDPFHKSGAVYVDEPVTTSLPTLPVSGLTLLGAPILLSGVGAHWALAGRHSPADPRDAEGVDQLTRQGTTSRPR